MVEIRQCTKMKKAFLPSRSEEVRLVCECNAICEWKARALSHADKVT